ncbi:DUF1684 domain-containing protein [Halorarius litoreus]|uniref:DUF1684 domain-containing protein n=1 Tax=Halorarius litoreus TaxID=2962676 RepID=UPI0020CCF8CD|nr:DUF1684 domain-containing protein [Halorarius litoreus]
MSDDEFDEAAWERELRQHRDRKDEFFATDRQSPIPQEQRDAFDGLSYFEPDADYRVEADVELVDGDDVVTMDTTVDTQVEYERVARLHFELNGEQQTLVAYQQAGEHTHSLFVPFRDKTTGQQTYGAGRYMEFEVDGHLSDAATVPLDFNLAYSPFCAYNDAFACPLPPEENWLDVAVEAGEKLPDA